MNIIHIQPLTLQLKGRGALIISAMLDFLTFSLCAPHSETTDGKCFEQLLQMVADMGRCVFKLFQVRYFKYLASNFFASLIHSFILMQKVSVK